MNDYERRSIRNIWKFTKGGGMKGAKYSLKDIISLYYGDTDIVDINKINADEILKSFSENGFENECSKIAGIREKRTWRIGGVYLDRAVCIAIMLSLLLVVTGFIVISRYIDRIRILDTNNYSYVEIDYNKNSSIVSLDRIESYKEPDWIPDGYYIDSIYKKELEYTIIYQSNEGFQIVYSQYVPGIKHHYSAETGNHQIVTFGEYSGEFVETDTGNYLIVTDGIYLYSLTADYVDRDSLIKMLP